MFLFVIILGILIGLISGGKLSNLSLVKFYKFTFMGIFILFIDLILRNIIYRLNISGGNFMFYIYPYIGLAFYLLVIVILDLNKHLKGFRLVEAGFILNFLPMVLNSGKMPVSKGALSSLGQDETILALERGLNLTHDLIVDNTNFKILSDIIPIDFFFQTVISLGDIVISIGLMIFLIYYMKKDVN